MQCNKGRQQKLQQKYPVIANRLPYVPSRHLQGLSCVYVLQAKFTHLLLDMQVASTTGMRMPVHS